MLLGATHSRLTEGNPYALSRDDDAHNFESYLNAVGETAMPSSRPAVAGERAREQQDKARESPTSTGPPRAYPSPPL